MPTLTPPTLTPIPPARAVLVANINKIAPEEIEILFLRKPLLRSVNMIYSLIVVAYAMPHGVVTVLVTLGCIVHNKKIYS